MRLPLDVPATVVFVHLAALATLLLRAAVVQLRRAAVVRRSRGRTTPPWLQVLFALLGPPGWPPGRAEPDQRRLKKVLGEW